MIILQAQQIERSFAGEVLFDNISLQVDERDRIALVGRNGAGKSTLLKLLVGQEKPSSGTINQKRDLRLSYLDQESQLSSDKTIYEELLTVFASLRQDEKRLRQLEEEMSATYGDDLDRLMATYDRLTEDFRHRGGFTYESDLRTILNAFKFDESMWQMPVTRLSGGQKTRLALAKILLEKPELLVLDEPTNHLDIETIAWLEDYLRHYQGALILVSHDRYFLDKVATVILDLNPHHLDRYTGNYSQFMAQKATKQQTEINQFEKQQKEIAKLETFIQKNIVRKSTTKQAQSRRRQLEKMERLDRPNQQIKSARMDFAVKTQSGNQVLAVEQAAIGYTKLLSGPIDLSVKKQDAIAIVGPNGVGKTSLLRSIVGEIPLLDALSLLAQLS